MNFETIHNYYESLVIEHVMNTVARERGNSEDELEDIVCLALNQLPARYVRHDVDMAFFLTTREREKMQRDIQEAVLTAVRTVTERNREH
ncbi:MAG: late competence development ComFB family protein [Gammaproteobacteria bacterium]|nr:late competence development ComFB family protein [Gammaproteobacteria bacterium]